MHSNKLKLKLKRSLPEQVLSVGNTKFSHQCGESPKFLSLHKYFSNPKPVSFGFEADVVVSLGLKEEINLLAAKVPPRCPPCCLN